MGLSLDPARFQLLPLWPCQGRTPECGGSATPRAPTTIPTRTVGMAGGYGRVLTLCDFSRIVELDIILIQSELPSRWNAALGWATGGEVR